jgi:hypothetical protein
VHQLANQRIHQLDFALLLMRCSESILVLALALAQLG